MTSYYVIYGLAICLNLEIYVTRWVTFGPNAQMTSQNKMTLKICIKFLFLIGFSPAHKNCKKLFSDTILYRWYKYIISLQNYLIKLTPNVLIKMYRLYTWNVHHSWWFRHLLQSGDIDINNRNIFVLFLKLKSSNLAISNDTKFSISLKKAIGHKMSDSDTYMLI